MEKVQFVDKLFKFKQEYNKKDFKVHEEQQLGFNIIDVSLKARNFQEDAVYTSNPQYLLKIRRGNSFILDKGQPFVLRRGLIKFFDVNRNYLQQNKALSAEHGGEEGEPLEDLPRNFIKGTKGSAVGKNINVVNFLRPLKCLASGIPVRVYKLIKANGENGQISYCAVAKRWVVCSKNVAMLTNGDKESEQLLASNQRYSFAAKIAKVWLGFVHSLQAEKAARLKQYLSTHTIVCEYVGSEGHQHLVKYKEESLLFYAITENDVEAEDSCLHPEQAYAFFNDFGLKTVGIKDCGIFATPVSFFDGVISLFEEVSKGDLDREEEGSVLYFTGEKRTLSLVKLKTLEYRLWRKLREKIKHVGNKPVQRLHKEYCNEVRGLVEQSCGGGLSRPLQFFNEVAKVAFNYVQTSKIKNIKEIVAETFIDFLSTVLYCECVLRKSVTDELMSDKEIVGKAQRMDWNQFPWPPETS